MVFTHNRFHVQRAITEFFMLLVTPMAAIVEGKILSSPRAFALIVKSFVAYNLRYGRRF